MSDDQPQSAETTSIPEKPSGIPSPENLPPVEPPSAGFILQLFVVPAIIVGAVIGIWLLFGRIASTDQDWQRQIDELKQSNEHRRWRGAVSLVQMLQADSQAGEESENLSENRDLALSLGNVFEEQRAVPSPTEKDRKLLAYLTIALGWLNVDEVTLPLLIAAMQPDSSSEVRQNAMTSLALIAGRQFEKGESLQNEPLTEELLQASQDDDPRIRQLAAYTLGLLDADVVDQRLNVMLEDPDQFVRVNAAIALARQKSTQGLDILQSILERAGSETSPLESIDPEVPDSRNDAHAAEIELVLMTKNSLTAVEELLPQLSESEKAELKPAIEKLSKEFRDPRIRLSAQQMLKSMQ